MHNQKYLIHKVVLVFSDRNKLILMEKIATNDLKSVRKDLKAKFGCSNITFTYDERCF